MDVQAFEPNVFDIDYPAGTHTDNPRNPIRRRLPQLARLANSLAEHAEITGTHGLEMGLHSMRQAALGEMSSRIEWGYVRHSLAGGGKGRVKRIETKKPDANFSGRHQ